MVALCAITTYAVSGDAGGDGSDSVIQSVTDGDTITVVVQGKREKVRLIGVDTPETVDPRRPVGCYGKEASEFTKSQLPKGTEVRLVLDAEPRDRYGRLLAYVYRASDEVFINAELAKHGYAQPLTIPPNVAHADEFARLSAEARENNRGLWAKCNKP